uniref:Malectin-like domain-containing protein n=1 Tax=Ananas comosus var. bracteatus TaxID=296719 RepID=A0A6V7PXI0_ANACO|nr:unnamed protein product [Ananas comosus var. bracteatus]
MANPRNPNRLPSSSSSSSSSSRSVASPPLSSPPRITTSSRAAPPPPLPSAATPPLPPRLRPPRAAPPLPGLRGLRLRAPGGASLHRTARVFPSPSSYEFEIKEKGSHLLRLHFYPFVARGYDLSSASFHVSASGFTLLANFTTADPVLKEFVLWIDSDKLVLSFVPAQASSFAFVNAIEVVSAPKDLIGDVAIVPNQLEKFNGVSRQALETLYRINVGGPKVTPFNDTLWRTWVPDNELFVESDSTSKTLSFSGRIAYQKYGASREVAPDNVYSTARVVDGSDSNHNMTWVFPVSSGYKYLIRLHFCDIASLALNQLYFNIYVNGNSGYGDFDLSDAAGHVLASPYYIDFVADADNSGKVIVTIGPSKLSSPSWIHGLLNGVEVMKMNNSIGSLDGDASVVLVTENPVKRGFGEFVRSILCGFAFMSLLGIVFMLVMRLRAESGRTVLWSPLPTDVSGGKWGQGFPVASGKLEL